MTDNLVKRLRQEVESECLDMMMLEAADRIEELEKRVEQAKIVFATMRSEMANVCAVMKAFEDE